MNLLPKVGLHAKLDSEGNVKEYANDIDLMEHLENCNDLDLYTSHVMTNLTKYKWTNLGFKWHMINVVMNVVYISQLANYIQLIYIDYKYADEPDSDEAVSYRHGRNTYLIIGLFYPVFNFVN